MMLCIRSTHCDTVDTIFHNPRDLRCNGIGPRKAGCHECKQGVWVGKRSSRERRCQVKWNMGCPSKIRSWEQHAFRVYGNDELVLVWSYNYVCGRGHNSNSLMCNLDEYTKAFLPMLCFKEVGLTNSLLYDIVEQASRGCSFKMIEKCIRARYQGKHAAKLTQAKMFQQFNKQPRLKPWQESPNFLDRMERACPSDNLLRDAFLAYFHQHENFFRCSMATLPVDTLRIDHTFKTAMNVGFARKRVQQYSAVFFALNADNQVVGWQFCRNLRHVTLQLLLKRFPPPLACYCCFFALPCIGRHLFPFVSCR